MKRLLGSWLVLAGLGSCFGLAFAQSSSSAQGAKQAADAIIELDVKRGQALLEEAGAAGGRVDLAFERARLALYLGDCETAQAILGSPQLAKLEETRHFREVSDGCVGATSGGLVIDDAERGVWLRLQDEEDRALAPRIIEVAAKARLSIEQSLGVDLPRPMRIDLVRDLFSLAAVSGLPIEAAETTGTVAVARWGRVTMLTPRAAAQGYPWQDTLAHEIAHLVLSRATRDRAPLWLQEGVAKREETRWREEQPFDKVDYDRIARKAQLEGKSVGVDGLGASIAMLPTPEAASIAFAEVTSFIGFWLEQNGAPAFQLLLRDLKGVGRDGPDAALRSVTGLELSEWNTRWQRWLELKLPKLEERAPMSALEQRRAQQRMEDAVRYARLGDLLFEQGYNNPAENKWLKVFDAAPDDANIRARLARAALARGDQAAAQAWVARLTDVSNATAHYWSLRARFGFGAGEQVVGTSAAHQSAYDLAVSVDPLSELVACGGYSRSKASPLGAPPWEVQTDASPPSFEPDAGAPSAKNAVQAEGSLEQAYVDLCEAARRFGRD